MAFTNRFTQLKQQLALLPADAQATALTATLQRMIPILGTLGVTVDEYEPSRCRLHLPNNISVQNGWGGIQAGGIYTTAESVMALVVGANLPDDRLVVAKSVTIDYLRKAKDGITATALLTDEQATHVQQADKGELTLESSVTDETGVTVSRCRAVWVWHSI
ncbi:MAG: YiiD C-terminal domain-containing protein [Spirosoma sp.]|nr:YiiD C-terminal domain-containing protein [Spirosoma sp.]